MWIALFRTKCWQVRYILFKQLKITITFPQSAYYLYSVWHRLSLSSLRRLKKTKQNNRITEYTDFSDKIPETSIYRWEGFHANDHCSGLCKRFFLRRPLEDIHFWDNLSHACVIKTGISGQKDFFLNLTRPKAQCCHKKKNNQNSNWQKKKLAKSVSAKPQRN